MAASDESVPPGPSRYLSGFFARLGRAIEQAIIAIIATAVAGILTGVFGAVIVIRHGQITPPNTNAIYVKEGQDIDMPSAEHIVLDSVQTLGPPICSFTLAGETADILRDQQGKLGPYTITLEQCDSARAFAVVTVKRDGQAPPVRRPSTAP